MYRKWTTTPLTLPKATIICSHWQWQC